MDSVGRYLEVFESLRRQKRWGTDVNVLRFAALTLAATDVSDPGAELESAARVLREQAGWTSPLRSSLRYGIAAMIVRRGRDARTVHDRVEEVRTRLRERRMRRGGAYEVLAALLLVLDAGDKRVSDRVIDRLQKIMTRWKKDHRFLTGVDDYPFAALHAVRDISVEGIAIQVEQIYERLRVAGYSRGNQLQLTSHLLAVSPDGPFSACRRFGEIVRHLGRRGIRVSPGRYDETAILALTSPQPSEIARRVVELRDRLRAVRPRPSNDVAFSLAAGLFLAADAARQVKVGAAGELATVRAAQALIEAQQAAMCVAISAAVAASAATTAAH